MSLSTLLKTIKKGTHPACRHCPWNPQLRKETAFGASCVKHGIDWTSEISAVSLLVARDPAGTTPSKTGDLCGFCNAQYVTDHSANHGYSLWKAAVSLSDSGQEASKYMKNHYWTNAIMHGVAKDKRIEEARICCKTILYEQIVSLSPRIIITCGKDAAKSLFELGFISKPWDVFKSEFAIKVYSEQTILPSGTKAIVYCTYHGSATAVNTHVARLYSNETEDLLSQKIKNLPVKLPAQNFIRQHQGLNGEDKGMRVLLLHWLEIGESIRRVNAEVEFSI